MTRKLSDSIPEAAMRLTLRTLLAYRDGVLSPSETRDLHQRIRQTEVANNLLRRVDNLVKNQQLLAPKLVGEGLGADANSVAEYLDDTLASEQVPEFERICIAESDLVLAELAHCHQLLADAISSQVIVPQDLRSLAISLTNPQNQSALQRRLKIGGKKSASNSPAGTIRRADNPHPEKLVEAVEVTATEAISSKVQAPMVASGGGSIKPQGLDLERPQLAHEVPEYLVGQRSGGWRIPLAIGAMIALLSVIAWQALGPLSNVRELFVAQQSVPIPETTTNSDVISGKSDNAVKPTFEVANRPIPKPDIEKTVDDAVSSSASTSENAIEDGTSLESQVPTSEASKLAEIAPPEPKVSSDPDKSTFRWTPSSEDAKSVLFFRRSADRNRLQRIVANTSIPPDGEIVVPPSMRPTLNLADQCTWSVCGPTLMQLSENENVTITTSLCRAITKGGAAGRTVTIAAPSGPVNLQFEEATSMAAIEVAFRPVSHGLITDRVAFKPFLIIVAVEGQISVTPVREAVESKKIRLVVGEGVAYSDGAPIEFELGAIPIWYRAGNDRPVDSLAANDMNKSINGTEDVAAQLTSLCSDRRPETAALAIQSEILLGDWSSFASDFLNNESMRNHWASAIGLAEQMVAASEPNAEALRSSLEAAHVGRGGALYSLFAGVTDGLQPKEFLPKVVEALDSGELDERVLAAHQLRRLTGKDLGFQPSIPNRAVLQQWRRTIASNPIVPIDNPIWEAKPVSGASSRR